MPLVPRSNSRKSKSKKKAKHSQPSNHRPTGTKKALQPFDYVESEFEPLPPPAIQDTSDDANKRKEEPPEEPVRSEDDPFDEDEPEERSVPAPNPRVQSPPPIIRYPVVEKRRTSKDDMHEIFLYVFSGVLLLFILEQFIQIGVYLGSNSM